MEEDFMNLCFIGEFGRKEMSYEEYLTDQDMRYRINDPDRERLILGRTVLTYDPKWLKEHTAEHDNFMLMKDMLDENPLMFFSPSGDGGVEFLNDTEHDIKMMIAPNRVGKTASGVVDILLDAIPTGKSWPIYKNHGVNYRKWRGPLELGFASSNWNVVSRVLWPEIKKWIPKYELGDYDPRLKKHRDIAWRVDPSITLSCGTKIFFFCYEQEQAPFESQALDRWYWDEQGDEAKFDGGDERLRTRKGRHVFGMTPHKVEGRPDTGARSWIHKMVTGQRTKGHRVGVHHISIRDVPDWVYPESGKLEAYQKWVEQPLMENNQKAIKEGRARFYGEWHDAAGLVYDEWDENVHVIDPFQIPDHWTRYRAIDHGVKNPTACLWGAVSPEGDICLYREYYKAGLTVSENCRNIIKLSGNEVIDDGTKTDPRSRATFQRIIEQTVKEKYMKTVLDSRSMATKDALTQMDLGKLYGIHGVRVFPASGLATEKAIPIVKELLTVDLTKKHPYTGEMGCSRIFVFRDLHAFTNELRGYAMQEYKSSKAADQGNLKEKPIGKNDHLMDCFLYLVQIPARYILDRWGFYNAFDSKEEEEWLRRKSEKKTGRHRDPITGY